MMKHGRLNKRFNRSRSHFHSLFKNLAKSIGKCDYIKMSAHQAKFLKRFVDKLANKYRSAKEEFNKIRRVCSALGNDEDAAKSLIVRFKESEAQNINSGLLSNKLIEKVDGEDSCIVMWTYLNRKLSALINNKI